MHTRVLNLHIIIFARGERKNILQLKEIYFDNEKNLTLCKKEFKYQWIKET